MCMVSARVDTSLMLILKLHNCISNSDWCCWQATSKYPWRRDTMVGRLRRMHCCESFNKFQWNLVQFWWTVLQSSSSRAFWWSITSKYMYTWYFNLPDITFRLQTLWTIYMLIPQALVIIADFGYHVCIQTPLYFFSNSNKCWPPSISWRLCQRLHMIIEG